MNDTIITTDARKIYIKGFFVNVTNGFIILFGTSKGWSYAQILDLDTKQAKPWIENKKSDTDEISSMIVLRNELSISITADGVVSCIKLDDMQPLNLKEYEKQKTK